MNIVEIANKIVEKGGNLYQVGGSIRDSLLHIPCKDEDYCITGITPQVFMQLFPQAKYRGKKFAVWELEGKEFALARRETKTGVGHKDFKIETGVNIEEDLERRDITINSIAKEVLTGKIIDPFGGIQDLQEKKIRKTSSRFREDPLRVYRVARFVAQLEFAVTPETLEEMELCKDELKTISVERVFEEWKKAMLCRKPSLFFYTLKQTNLLGVHFPELEGLLEKNQMQTVDFCTTLTKKPELQFASLVYPLEEKIETLGNRLKIPKLWMKCGKLASKEYKNAENFDKMTSKEKVEWINQIEHSPLHLEGMEIIMQSIKRRNNPMKFREIGENCLQTINGEYIKEKYGKTNHPLVGKLLERERILWINQLDE